MRISDWSSDVCSSDLSQCIQLGGGGIGARAPQAALLRLAETLGHFRQGRRVVGFQEGSHGRVRQVSRVDGIEVVIRDGARGRRERSEEHTSELQSLMRISYAAFFLNKKTQLQ